MNISALNKIARLLNINHIQYRVEPDNFLGETLRFVGAGWTIHIDDGDKSQLCVIRRTKSAKTLEYLHATLDLAVNPFK